MSPVIAFVENPAVPMAGFALLSLLLGILLWHHIKLLADERERNREANRVAALFEDVGGFQSAERGLRAAIEALPDAFVLYDPEDRLVICNTRYRELYAASADVIRVGSRFEDMLRTGVARGQYAQAQADPESWIAERLAMHRSPPKVPIEQKLGDGRWLRVFERRMADGHKVGFRIDMTELKQREEALRLSEGRLAAVVQGALEAMVAVDAAGCIREFNPAAERLFGFARAAVLGENARDLLVPERYRELYDRRIAAMLGGADATDRSGERIEARSLRADGSEILTEIAFNRVEGREGPLVIGFVRDITEERARMHALRDALAQAEAADRAKSRFLAMMSHEIRTPLNAVIGLLDMMMDEPLGERQRARAHTARGSASALLRILNDILDLSRIEAGRVEFVSMPFVPRDLVAGVRDLLEGRAQAKGLAFTTEVADDVPAVLAGDAGRLRQVLINLVSNAVKFTPRGAVRLDLSLRAGVWRDREGAAVWPLRFCVEDTGPGIAEEQRALVFERFRTLERQDGGRSEGVGLGLTICRELVAGMGGSIRLTDAPGGGCRFLVDLDLPEAAVQAVTSVPREIAAADAALLRGASILVAEDNATNRMIVECLLARWGCRFRCVHDGEEVLAALTTGRFDAVIMDVSVPGLDGYEATRRIRAGTGGGEGSRDVPILALTAHALAGERARAAEAGMSGFVTKPVDAVELAEELARLLRARREAEPSPAAVIDRARLESTLADIPCDRRAALIERCVADLVEQAGRAGAVAEAEAPPDAAGLVAIAHLTAGLAETFGADALAERARAIELAGPGAAGREAASGLASETERAARALAALAAELARPAPAANQAAG